MSIRDLLVELAQVLPRLAMILERQSEARDRVEPLAYRIDQVAAALGVSRRTLERALSAGKFPKPDLRFGKSAVWRIETLRDFLEDGGRM
jgi:predicted DNA-binding transcriptional regulator AlpA